MLPLKSKAPDFSLPDVTTGKTVSLSDFADKKAFLVIFLCNHCPYVQHVKTELVRVGLEYQDKDVGVVGISANDAEAYPDDAPEALAGLVKELGMPFPILYDETQEVAKAYTAACTPDCFLFDKSRTLVYRGQLGDSRPGSGKPLRGLDLRAAIDAVLSDSKVNPHQKPSVGCNIKWKPGNEPDYFKNPSTSSAT